MDEDRIKGAATNIGGKVTGSKVAIEVGRRRCSAATSSAVPAARKPALVIPADAAAARRVPAAVTLDCCFPSDGDGCVMSDKPILPAHIEDTVQSIARLYAEHYQQATRLQRIVTA